MKSNSIIIIFLLFLTLWACKSNKVTVDVAETINIKSLNQGIKTSIFDYEYFSGKARMQYSDKSMNQGFTANIRMKKNEFIWMSLTGPFGIEGARVLITKNKVQIIDRLNRVYYDQPLSFVSNYVPFDVDLAFLQNMIVANPLQDEIPKQKVGEVGNKYLAMGNLGSVGSIYYILPELFKYHKVEMKDSKLDREIVMDFEEYKTLETSYFPYQRMYKFNDNGNQISINMNFARAKIEETLDYNFTIPENYKRVE
jgi:hypothetical protein